MTWSLTFYLTRKVKTEKSIGYTVDRHRLWAVLTLEKLFEKFWAKPSMFFVAGATRKKVPFGREPGV